MPRPTHVLRAIAIGLGLGVLLVAAGVFFLNRTERGQTLVIRIVTNQIENAIDGTIMIDSVRSRGILGGATLYGVEVTGREDGRTFLTVDSLETAYDWHTFLQGQVVLSSLVLFGPRLTISRYPGEDDFNADRIFRVGQPRQPRDTTRVIRLEKVRLVDGFVEILEPVDAGDPLPPRMITVPLPGGGATMHRIYFEDIQAILPSVLVASPETLGPEAEVSSLSMTGYVYDDPFHLTQLEGTVGWAEGKLVIVAEELSLPDTRAEGRIVADFTAEGRGGRDTGWAVDLQLESPHYALRDLRWILPTLPAGTGQGTFNIRFTDLGEVRVGFERATLAMNGGRLSGDGAFVRNNSRVFSFRDVRLRAESLSLDDLEPFVDSLPLHGTIQGQTSLDGPLTALRAQGRVTLVEPGYEVSSADFSGTFHLGDRRGVTDLVAGLDPFDLRLLKVLMPENRLAGLGRGRVQATGNLDEGVVFESDIVHEPGRGLPASRVAARGTVRKLPEDVTLDLDADVTPLSLTALREYFPDLPFTGEVSGSIHASGPLTDLTLRTDLDTEAGHLALDTRFDARDPGAYYRVQGQLEDFTVSRLVPELPDPTVLTGTLSLEGRGTDLATATVEGSFTARDSRVWELDVDSARFAVRVRDGVVLFDTANARVSGVTLQAQGALAAREGGPAGQIHVVFQSDSLQGLRPVLMGREVRARTDLTELERQTLRTQGVDPDTLPTAEEIAISGRTSGEATLAGSLERFSVEGQATFQDVRYGLRTVSGARVTFSADGLPDVGESWTVRAVTDSVSFGGLGFRNADVALSYARPTGNAEVFLERNDRESYRSSARFQLDSLGGRVDLETLAVRLDSLTWNLTAPATISWDSMTVRVAGLALARSGEEGGRIEVDGVLREAGEVDLSVDLQGLPLEDLSRVLQRERSELGGRVNLGITVRGLADDPFIVGALAASDVRFQRYALDRVQGDVGYRNRRLTLNLEAWEGDLRVLEATGFVPMTLDFSEPTFSFPDEEIDLRVVADRLPAAFVAGLFPVLVDVDGTVGGQFDIAGTIDNPTPSGRMQLQNAAWTIEALGVRHESASGTLTLRPDALMEVELYAEADGNAYVSGTVKLAPLRNPEFDLKVSFTEFLLAQRRDVEGHASGVMSLTGTFDRPVVQGLTSEGSGLYVDRGVLYIEEAVRSATVVDLSDPRFASFVDVSLLEPRILEESRNPFMQNLFVNVDLIVEQDTWLRSSEMNVEIAGNLAVHYDAARVELVLVGQLQALRGPYTVLGHRFDVQSGTIEFVGLPGVNPNLDIVASTRVRRRDEPLDIIARVTGTLTEPRVVLSSEESGISQSDLVSYLLFGMPSYELGAGQRAELQSTVGSFLGAGSYALGNVFRSAVTTRLGAVLAQQWGLDYFAITEAGNMGWDYSAVSQTQVEVGQYLTQDLFLIFAFQPVRVVGSNLPFYSTFGLRMEYSPTTAFTLQAFWEDRFLRSRTVGFQDVAFSPRKILGLLLFREWGY